MKHELLGALAMIAACVSPPAVAGTLRAGASRMVLTPPADAFPIKQPGEKDFVGVHDDIYVRALALDDGSRRVLLLGLETTSVPHADELLAAVSAASGVPRANIFAFASHTHSNPLVFYHNQNATPRQTLEIARTRDQAVAAAREAIAKLAPARVAFGRGTGWININNGEGAGLSNGFDPAGPSDKTLDVLRITATDGSPIALLVNYASHAEVMFRSVTKDGGYEVTGDLPGAVSRNLEGPLGAPVVLFSAGAEADQLSLFKSLQYPNGKLPVVDEGANGWALMNVQARQLTASVIDVLDKLAPATGEVTINAAQGIATCPGQRLRINHDNGKATRTDTADVDIPLSLLRIGDVALAGVGGDVASEIGSNIRSSVKGRKTMVVTMLAGSVGYILPDAAYAKPGHGVMASSLKPGCAPNAILRGLRYLDAALPKR